MNMESQKETHLQREAADDPHRRQKLLLDRIRNPQEQNNVQVLARLGLKEAQNCFPGQSFPEIPVEREAFIKWFESLYEELCEQDKKTLLFAIATDALVMYDQDYEKQTQTIPNQSSYDILQRDSKRRERPKRMQKFRQILTLLSLVLNGKIPVSSIDEHQISSSLRTLRQIDLKENGRLQEQLHNPNGALLNSVYRSIIQDDFPEHIADTIFHSVILMVHERIQEEQNLQHPLVAIPDELMNRYPREALQVMIETSWIPALVERTNQIEDPEALPTSWFIGAVTEEKEAETKEEKNEEAAIISETKERTRKSILERLREGLRRT